MDAAERTAALPALEVVLNEAKIARDTHRIKLAEAALLQARVKVAALGGDVDAANVAWDRLFDVTTGLRGAAQKLQRAGTPDAAKDAAYEQARAYNLPGQRLELGRERRLTCPESKPASLDAASG